MSEDQVSASDIKRRILLADDEPIGQMAAARILQEAGYDVHAVDNGMDAIEATRSGDYDLVLMDCSMPVMDGFEASRMIRAGLPGAREPEIPIVALTGMETAGDRQKCLQAGMTECLVKPVRQDSLLTVVARLLEPAIQGQASATSVDLPAPGSGLDEQFVDQLIDKFMDEIPDFLGRLQAALDNQDLPALRSISHRIRGPLALLKVDTLSLLARDLERFTETANERVTHSAEELITELKNLLTINLDG